MQKPNFSENQLLTCVNSAIVSLLSANSIFTPTITPSTFEEKRLGWDTAFYFPFIGKHPGDFYGNGIYCNFFIQYKRSFHYLGRNTNESSHWKKSYYKFQIPYGKDYTQFNTLKKLADKGYATYYVTNKTLELSELIKLQSNSERLDNIPFLDVSDIKHKHRNVSFTEDSSYFLLHSVVEKVPIKLFKQIYNSQQKSQNNVIHNLSEIIISFEKSIEISGKGSFGEKFNFAFNTNYQLERKVRKIFLIKNYLLRYFDIYWIAGWKP